MVTNITNTITMPFETLPFEIVLQIVDHLDRPSIVSLSRTTKRLRPPLLSYLSHHSVIVRLPQSSLLDPPCLTDITLLSQLNVDLTPYTTVHDPIPHHLIKPHLLFALVLLESTPENLLIESTSPASNLSETAPQHWYHPHLDANHASCWIPPRPWARIPRIHPVGTPHSDRALLLAWRLFTPFPCIRSVTIELRILPTRTLPKPLQKLHAVHTASYPSHFEKWGNAGLAFAQRWFCGNPEAQSHAFSLLAGEHVIRHPDGSINYSDKSYFRSPALISAAQSAGLVRPVTFTVRTVVGARGVLREWVYADARLINSCTRPKMDPAGGLLWMGQVEWAWRHREEMDVYDRFNRMFPAMAMEVDHVVWYVHRRAGSGFGFRRTRMVPGYLDHEGFGYEPRRTVREIRLEGIEFDNYRSRPGYQPNLFVRLHKLFKKPERLQSLVIKNCRLKWTAVEGFPGDSSTSTISGLLKKAGIMGTPDDFPCMLERWTWEKMFMSVRGKRWVGMCTLEELEDNQYRTGVPEEVLRKWERHVLKVVDSDEDEPEELEVAQLIPPIFGEMPVREVPVAEGRKIGNDKRQCPASSCCIV